MRRLLLFILLGFLTLTAHAAAARAADWKTPAEAAEFRTTPDYAHTLAYLQRLQQASPGMLRIETFGTTPQGRPLSVVIASAEGTFDPAAARAARKPVVLLQAGIHPGEIEGKDAGLMLLRDLAIMGKYPHVLDHVVLVYIPVFSVDGHENASPYHRINQNGPASMGFRGQAQYLNLNRDYLKADAPEMRAWLKLWQRWLPDLLIDIHTTDGADYQYDLTWYTEDPHKLDPAIDRWLRDAMHNVLPAYEQRSHLASIYLNFKDNADPHQGIANFGSGPRFSTGYAALQNRPALLVETHMLKPYANRVRATYDIVELMLAQVAKDRDRLLAATRMADANVIARAQQGQAQVPITFKPDPHATPIEIKGYAFTRTPSAISGAPWIHYDRGQPDTFTVNSWNGLLPDVSIAPPAAYVIPAQWTVLIDALDAHGISYRRLRHAQRIDAQGYQLEHPMWATQPFEGHLVLRQFNLAHAQQHVQLAPGSVVVALDQRAANVAINLLEPQAPDSLLHWGFLNAIFEAKEYAEPRVAEQLARTMLARDPALQAAFTRKLQDDPAFAADPRARLEYFFERSPWYSAQQVGAYPVLRLNGAQLRSLDADLNRLPADTP